MKGGNIRNARTTKSTSTSFAGATETRRSALNPKSSASALSSKLVLLTRNNLQIILNAEQRLSAHHRPNQLFVLWSHSGSRSDLEKTLNCQACFQSRKTQKTDPRGLPRTQQIDHRITIKHFFENDVVLRDPAVNNSHPKSVQKVLVTWTQPQKYRI